MPEREDPPHPLPESRVVPRRRSHISFVWVVPIVAALVGVWVLVTQELEKGPEITITFESAEGLTAGKTRIDYKGLTVGGITEVKLSKDKRRFVAHARMDSTVEELLRKDTSFWIVRPEISGLNITGLSTLVSGDYIGMQAGSSTEARREFVALKTPPLPDDVPGRLFILKTPQLGSIDRGTPIYYRHLQAGQVVSHKLAEDGLSLTVEIFVQAPYDKFVTTNTRFWQASGIDMSLTASGLQVRTESLLSILAGGVAFESPAGEKAQPLAEASSVFELFSDRQAAFQPPPEDPHTYVLVFEQSVRGLSIGAPVDFAGIRIGEVLDVSARFDPDTRNYSAPVTIRLDPKRFGVDLMSSTAAPDSDGAHRKLVDDLVASGLRAQLKEGSLLSGAMFVSILLVPDAPPVTLDWSKDPVELPTVPGQLEAMEARVESIIKKLDEFQFEALSASLVKSLDELELTLAGARGTFTHLDTLLESADTLIEPTSNLVGGMESTLAEFGGAARSLRVLMDYLERHPEALLRGKTGGQ